MCIRDRYIGEVEKRGGTPVLMTANAADWWEWKPNGMRVIKPDAPKERCV